MSRRNLTEIPVRFGRVSGAFLCANNQLTTLKNCPTSVEGWFNCYNNNLTDYFKNIKEEDFPYWNKLDWYNILMEYPFLINIGKKYLSEKELKEVLNQIPLTKIYLE